MVRKEEKKRVSPQVREEWKGVKVEESVTDGNSASRVVVDTDTTGWDKPEAYDFKAPERKEYGYKPDKSFMEMFSPEEPAYDYDREEHLKRVARVNAFGDLAKNLGALAGVGYAPTEKREENKEVLRAFSELDRMRDVYDARRERYNDKLTTLRMQDDAGQRAKHDREYEREYDDAKSAYEVGWKNREELRRLKTDAHYRNNTTQETRQSGRASQYRNLNLPPDGPGAGGGGRSGGDGTFDAYIKGVGDLRVSRSAQVQVGARIKDAMLDAGLVNEKDAAGLMAALKGPDSRTAFQSMLGYMRYKDVWDACKQFLGHGMTLYNAEGGGVPTDNGGRAESGAVSPKGYDYGNLTY